MMPVKPDPDVLSLVPVPAATDVSLAVVAPSRDLPDRPLNRKSARTPIRVPSSAIRSPTKRAGAAGADGQQRDKDG